MKLFEGLNDMQLLAVRSCASCMQFDPGGHLFREGDPAYGIYVIVTGRVEIYRKGPSGPVFLGMQAVDDVVGEFGLLNESGKRSASAKALERTTAFALPGNPIKLMERISDINAALTMLKNMIGIMGERLRRKDQEREDGGSEPDSAEQPLRPGVVRELERIRASFPQNSYQRFLTEKTLRPGEFLFREGDKSEGFYFVSEGVLSVEKRGADGALRQINRLRGPTLLGEIGYFGGEERSASVRAESRVVYLYFAGAEFARLERSDPRAAAEVAHAALKLAVMQFVQREEGMLDAELAGGAA